ncbi:MAG: hypothetical protein P8X86_15190 [Desulfofustis sp.]|jgi:hypothetical protein
MKRKRLSFDSSAALPAKNLLRTFFSVRGNMFERAAIVPARPHVAWYPLLLLIILFIFGGPLQAEKGSGPADKVPAGGEVTREPAPQQGPAETVVWPPPFKPSEEIGADSQISFPTDI